MIKWKFKYYSLLYLSRGIFFFPFSVVAAYACVACGNNSFSAAYDCFHLECDLWCTTCSATFSAGHYLVHSSVLFACADFSSSIPHEIVQRHPTSFTSSHPTHSLWWKQKINQIEYANVHIHSIDSTWTFVWLCIRITMCSQCNCNFVCHSRFAFSILVVRGYGSDRSSRPNWLASIVCLWPMLGWLTMLGCR